MNNIDNKEDPNGFALIPFLFFLVLFIGTGVYLTLSGKEMAFYQLSATVAILPAICLSVLQGKAGINKNITIFLYGMGEVTIITMCMIYLLAGAFASVASSIGSVSDIVNFGLSFLKPSVVLPGLFLICSFVSTSMGTSMGTIAAVAPIAIGIGEQTDINLSLLMGVVLGGAMFGDNLSMISDTTIASTRSQQCDMKDKFKTNFWIALPAALVTIIVLWYSGSTNYSIYSDEYEFIKVAPYILILIMALLGINVFIVLSLGIIFTGIVGLITVPEYSFLTLGKSIYDGFLSMNEIFILSMFIGGLGELIRYHGGIAWLLKLVNKFMSSISKNPSPKIGEWCISFLVMLTNLCVANNTVAIILAGKVSKEIADKYGIEPRKSASLLDIFSCIVQGLIPYGAQLLLIGSLSKLSPVAILLNNWYCMALFFSVCIFIFFD